MHSERSIRSPAGIACRSESGSSPKVSADNAFEFLKSAIRMAMLAREVRGAMANAREQQGFSPREARRLLGMSLWHLELLCIRLRDSLGSVDWLLQKLSVHALTCELNGDLDQASITLAMGRVVAGEAAVHDRPTFASPISGDTWA